MEKDASYYSLFERNSSEWSDTCVDSDLESSSLLFNNEKQSIRVKLKSGWRWTRAFSTGLLFDKQKLIRVNVTFGCKRTLTQSISLARFSVQALLTLLPSFIVRAEPRQPRKLGPTSALDGLRGFACFFVFNFHLLFTYSNFCQYGYGVSEDNQWFHQLPFLRLIYAGPAMVAIFFVISGYVLSHKPLKLIRKQSWDQVAHTTFSSVFRRAPRLFLPTVIGTFITMLLIQVGAFTYATEIVQDKETLLGHIEEHQRYFETFTEQFQDWQLSIWEMTNPWHWGAFFNFYDAHLWTIPVEFRSSIVLFVAIIGLSKIKTVFRITLLSWLIWYCVMSDRWEVTLFLSGMLLADLDLSSGLFDLTIEEPLNSLAQRWRSRLKRLLWIVVFIAGLYFASSPNSHEAETPGYRYLTTLIPKAYTQKYRWWQSVGSIMIVCSINNSKDIQPLFTNTFAQYLGRISYAFYIVHGPILHSLGYVAMKTSWGYTGKETMARYCLGFFLGVAVVLPVVFWAADVFWRLVDVPCVNFSRWVESKFSVKSE